MIFGMLMRNYKNYTAINYISMFCGEKFVAYLGDNGIGKSSILEALDTYFNNKEWNTTKGVGNTPDKIPFIALFHVLKKDRTDVIIANLYNDAGEYKNIIQKYTDYFKNMLERSVESNDTENEESQTDNTKKHKKAIMSDLVSLKKMLSDDYYIFISGIAKTSNEENAWFISIDNILKGLPNLDTNNNIGITWVNNLIREYYSYVYIPIEILVEDFTKISNLQMQKLIGLNIKNNIKNLISQNNIHKNINEELKNFIQSNIEKYLNGYKYIGEGNRINISEAELAETIIEKYFKIKVLHKKEGKESPIPVYNLSSGEKRQALIDVATAFINSQENEKEIILAIDEPESSLNSSKIYYQFEKLKDISERVYVLITTHWYGFLPTIEKGIAYYITKNDKQKNEFLKINLYNQLNRSFKLPININLKSNSELLHSIITSLYAEKAYNWIICEGISDKIYLSYFLKEYIKGNNLRIISMNGITNVIKIYKNLYSILSDDEFKTTQGSVLCLCDTDKERENVESYYVDKNNLKLFLMRLCIKEDITDLSSYNNTQYKDVVTMEHCLDGKIFIKTLKEFGNDRINKIFETTDYLSDNDSCVFKYLNLRPTDEKILQDFIGINGNKTNLANKYIKNCEINKTGAPTFINKLINKLKLKKT